jgi:hypothetical protein
MDDLDRNNGGEIVETLIEGQAILASSFYIDLVNLGLLKSDDAAARMRKIASLVGSPLHRFPAVAVKLQNRLNHYADALEKRDEQQRKKVPTLRVLKGGRP